MEERNANNFVFMKRVLDEIYKDMKGTEDEKYNNITTQCSKLFDFYKGQPLMNKTTEDIDYSIPETRFAYVYRNTGFHSMILSQLLQSEMETKPLSDLWQLNNIRVTALGGGPGSDALGIALFCQGLQKPPNVHVSNFDRKLWQDCWINVLDVLPNLNMSFFEFDATKSDRKMPTATNLVTMVYFVSEMYRYREEFKQFLHHAVEQFNPGTLFLVIEMDWCQFQQWIDKTFEQLGLKCCFKWKKNNFDIDDSYLNQLNPHYQKLIALNNKNKPRSCANIVYCLWQKPLNQ